MAARNKRVKIAPQLKEGEEGTLNRHWRTLFLDYLAESSNVTRSARRAGINPSRAYKLRREDPDFARAWLAALWEGYTHLELEVLRRLREGDMQTGDKASDRYDFANAIRLLTVHREAAAQAEAQMRNVSAKEMRAAIDRKMDDLRLQVEREKLAGK